MNIQEKYYNVPLILRIELDNEISLQLESTPPKAPGEARLNNTPEYLDINPFKPNFG